MKEIKWFLIFSVVFLAASAQANVENTEHVNSNIHNFATVLNERILSVSKSPDEFKHDLYSIVFNITKNLDADFLNYSTTVAQSLNISDQFHKQLLPCYETFGSELYNEYSKTREHIIQAFEVFKNFTNAQASDKMKTLELKSLKLNLDETVSACNENKDENAANKCQIKRLYELMIQVNQYSIETEKLQAQVAIVQEEANQTLDSFYLFASQDKNLYAMCQDIMKANTNEEESRFVELINNFISNISQGIEDVLKIQANSMNIIAELKKEGIDDITKTYENVMSDADKSQSTYESDDQANIKCTESFRKRISDVHGAAQRDIDNIYVAMNASLDQRAVSIRQTGDDLNSSLKSLLRTKQVLSDETRLNFFKDVVSQMKEIGKYDRSKLKLSQVESLTKNEIKKAKDKFYQEIFEAYNSQSICLKSHETGSLLKKKTFKARSSDKNALMDQLKDLINRTMKTETAVKQDNKKFYYDSFTTYHTALSNITNQELEYRTFDPDVYLPCFGSSRNKTIEAFSYLFFSYNKLLRNKFLDVDDKLKRLSHKFHQLLSRLDNISRECSTEVQKDTCLLKKTSEIKYQANNFNDHLYELDGESRQLQKYYTNYFDEFTDEVHNAIAKISPCVEYSLKYYLAKVTHQ